MTYFISAFSSHSPTNHHTIVPCSCSNTHRTPERQPFYTVCNEAGMVLMGQKSVSFSERCHANIQYTDRREKMPWKWGQAFQKKGRVGKGLRVLVTLGYASLRVHFTWPSVNPPLDLATLGVLLVLTPLEVWRTPISRGSGTCPTLKIPATLLIGLWCGQWQAGRFKNQSER